MSRIFYILWRSALHGARVPLPRDERHPCRFLQSVHDACETSCCVSGGMPNYLARGGSTVRIDWDDSYPDQYEMYFHCQTSLVDTFRELYGDTLRFEGKRAVVFELSDPVPVDDLKNCILMTLTYHHRRHPPMLGAWGETASPRSQRRSPHVPTSRIERTGHGQDRLQEEPQPPLKPDREDVHGDRRSHDAVREDRRKRRTSR